MAINQDMAILESFAAAAVLVGRLPCKTTWKKWLLRIQ
jgi:hypothetical protein